MVTWEILPTIFACNSCLEKSKKQYTVSVYHGEILNFEIEKEDHADIHAERGIICSCKI